MAVNAKMLFASGVNFVKAISRETGEQLWRIPLDGTVQGGPIVSNDLVLVVTNTGSAQILRSGDGAQIARWVAGSSVIAAPALTDPYVILPTSGDTVRVFRGVE
jgi:outer membrane protein assembly factor BamB